jgi:hypothetical protein
MAEKVKLKDNEIKLKKSGRVIKLKTLSIDTRDACLDRVDFVFDDKGNVKGVSAMQGTITHWMRTLIDGDISEDALFKYSMEERMDFYKIIFEKLFMGEN